MTFRGNKWKRNGNHFNLVGTRVRIYQYNTGKNANFMVEIIGIPVTHKSTFTIPKKGAEARDIAIKTAFILANKYDGYEITE